MVKPIRSYVLVRPFPSDEKSIGGIIVSDAHKAVNNKVEVMAVGNGEKNKPMKLKPGQTGFRVKDWGDEVEIDGVRHFLMKQDAILATL